MEVKEKAPMDRELDSVSKESRNIKSVKVIPVVQVTVKQGKGTTENHYRVDVEYWSLSGEVLAVRESRN